VWSPQCVATDVEVDKAASERAIEAWRDKLVERLVPRGPLSPSRLEKVALALLRERERH